MGKNLTLIGFMGTGKTSVGYLCAELLGWAFIDCDAQIEAAHQCTITGSLELTVRRISAS